MHSSMRLPRFSHGTPSAAKSSGHGEIPTPSPSRLFDRKASDDACLATRTGGRTGSLSTNGVSRSVDVTANRWAQRIIVSMNSLPCRNSRSPVSVYGYCESDSFG